jgi:drug/metabolite transporter (DMT)-like permease
MDLVLLLLLGAIWGSSYLFIKVIVGEVPVLTLVAGRLLLSAAVMWVLVPLLRHAIPRSRKLWGAYAVMGLLSGTLPYVLISWGEKYIPSGLAALLQSTMPIFTVLIAYLWGGGDGRMSLATILGVIIGFVGVGVLFIPDLREGLQASLLGQLAIVVSSASYAASAVFARRYIRGQPPLVSAMGQLTTGAIFTLPLALVVDRPSGLSPSLPATASWLALSILGTVVAYVIYYALIERKSATFVSTVTYVIPVNGLILGSLVLGEPLTGTVLLSLALILAGVLLVRR